MEMMHNLSGPSQRSKMIHARSSLACHNPELPPTEMMHNLSDPSRRPIIVITAMHSQFRVDLSARLLPDVSRCHLVAAKLQVIWTSTLSPSLLKTVRCQWGVKIELQLRPANVRRLARAAYVQADRHAPLTAALSVAANQPATFGLRVLRQQRLSSACRLPSMSCLIFHQVLTRAATPFEPLKLVQLS